MSVVLTNNCQVFEVFENGNICVTYANLSWNVTPNDVHHIIMKEPKMMSKGFIGLYASENDSLVGFTDDGNEYPLAMQVQNKQKYDFYTIYSILEKFYTIYAL